MGKITLMVEGTTVGTVATGGGVIVPYEVSEQDSARIVGSLAAIYASRLPENATITDIVKIWFDDVVSKAAKQAESMERKLAIREAEASVLPIVVTAPEG